MPRRARLAVPGIPWHIIQRGNDRSPGDQGVRTLDPIPMPRRYPGALQRHIGSRWIKCSDPLIPP